MNASCHHHPRVLMVNAGTVTVLICVNVLIAIRKLIPQRVYWSSAK